MLDDNNTKMWPGPSEFDNKYLNLPLVQAL
jgi:hypothetical protein